MRWKGWIVATAILAGAVPAQAAWREAVSEHFRIYTDVDDDGAARRFAERMERFDASLRRLRGVAADGPAANRLDIYVLKNLAAIARLSGREYVGGYYIPRWTGSVAFVPADTGRENRGKAGMKPEQILLHEYTHHFMFRHFPGAYPAWFSEGFAEFHGTTDIADDGSVEVGLGATHRAAELAYGNVPLWSLLSIGGYSPDWRATAAIYGKGWLLVHYLTFEKSRAGQLAAYFEKLQGGTPRLQAAQEAFGSLPALDHELHDYMLRKQLPAFHIPAGRLTPGPITVRTLGSGEAAMMAVHLRSTNGVAHDAGRVAAAAEKAAASFASDPVVQVWLAEAETDAHNWPQAQAAEDRALAADPRNGLALYRRADTAAAKARADKDHGAEAWNRVRALAAAANRADPGEPAPLVLYYESFVQQKAKPTPLAIAGLERAYALAPEATELRSMLARVYVGTGRWADAHAVLAMIAYDPHGGKMAAKAQDLLSRIDAGNYEGVADEAEKAFGENTA